MTEIIKTPRTDAHQVEWPENSHRWAAFARELERELVQTASDRDFSLRKQVTQATEIERLSGDARVEGIPSEVRKRVGELRVELMASGKADLALWIDKYILALLDQGSPSEVACPDPLKEMEARKDGAYEERNRVVAALARMAQRAGFRVGVAKTAIEGWSEDWHSCCYIDLPTGQLSWHFHDSHGPLFEGLPSYTEGWDGHDTPEKYRRLDEYARSLRPDEVIAAYELGREGRDACHEAHVNTLNDLTRVREECNRRRTSLERLRDYVADNMGDFAGKEDLLAEFSTALFGKGDAPGVARSVDGVHLIERERAEQVSREGWTPDHDDDHDNASLTRAALVYASLASFQIQRQTWDPVRRAGTKVPISWPWDSESFKPKDPIRNLVRAGALIAAEIDRVMRAEATKGQPSPERSP